MKRNKFLMPFFRLGRLGVMLSVLVAFSSCAPGFSGKPESTSARTQSLKVMNWNLQTFFDARFDGNEYAEYKNAKSGWSREKYEVRLERLASVIKELDADVIVMEELEKEEQLQDIANRLSGTFNFAKLYSHGLFATNKGASIGCAVLSRYPLGEVSVHSLEIRDGKKQPSMRPIIQFSVYVKEKALTIFVNHWKSKSGGEEASEIWRKRQEKLLAKLMEKSGKTSTAILATGDFNKDISEFAQKAGKSNKTNLILHGESDFEVYSPWILESGEYAKEGSYWYKNSWEKIDHFFAAGEIELEDFCAENAGEWADEQGHPLRYQIWNGKGYSDHLPITCTVRF